MDNLAGGAAEPDAVPGLSGPPAHADNNQPSSLADLDTPVRAAQPPVKDAWIDKQTLLRYHDRLVAEGLPLEKAQVQALLEHGLAAHTRSNQQQGELEEARAKIARLETELAHLPSMYASRAQLDLERASSENEQLLVQARTLARKLAEAEEDRRILSESTPAGRIGVPPSHPPTSGSSGRTYPSHAEAGVQGPEFKGAHFDMPASSELDRSAGPELLGAHALDLDPTSKARAPNGGAQIHSDASTAPVDQADLLKRENQALRIDKHSLEARLKIAEAQVIRAEHHLRDLRAGMLQGTPLVVVDHELALPSPPTSTQASPPQVADKFPPGKPRNVLLGDAEAELLLQAAKVHSHVNRINRVPLSRVIVEHAQEIIRAAPLVARGEASRTTCPGATATTSTQAGSCPTQGSSTSLIAASAQTAPAATPGGDSGATGRERQNTSGLFELVRASSQEDIDLPPVPAPHLAMPAPVAVLPLPPLGFAGSETRSKKRRRRSTEGAAPQDRQRKRSPRDEDANTMSVPQALVDATDIESSDQNTSDGDDDASDGGRFRDGGNGPGVPNEDLDHLPSPPAIFTTAGSSSSFPAGRSGTRTGKSLGPKLSALDVLAQASASQEAADYADAPTGEADSFYAKGKGKAKADPDAKGRSRSASSVGPDGKKARSPYIKWNVSEDEALIRAVIQCGCAWDSVAKLCPTRAYHQVRQRFLRGLKSGETLPPELMYLQPALLKSVQEYETKRKRKKLAKQAAQRFAEDALLDEQ
ncbi:hypothetical protein JCM3774_002984 [Rhodotorula dairenensis]